MRKSIKKIMSVVTAAAMTLAMVAVPSVKAMAADSYYVVGAEFGNWTPADAPAMTNNGDGTYSYSFAAEAGKCYEFQILPTNTGWDGQIGKAEGGNFAGLALEAKQCTIKFDPAKEGNARVTMDGLLDPNPAEEYYVVGIGSWDPAQGVKMTKNSDGTYSVTMELAGDRYEFKVVQDAPTYGWYKAWGDPSSENGNASNAEGLAWDKEKLTVTFNPADGTITSKAVEVVAKEDPTEEPTDEIDGDSLTVHVPVDWIKPKLYAFTTGGDNTPLLGDWPGTAMKANKDNKGYYSVKFALDTVEDITVIVSGTDADGKTVQTVNIPLEDITEGANEVWLTISDEKGEEDEFGNANFLAEYTTAEPDGWVASEVEEAEPEDETEAEDGEDGEDEEEGDDTAAWDSMKLKIHFLNSENWDKVGVYLTYGSWAEITGSWPGSEMGLEIGSETWYAVGTNGTKEETYNVIFNDMVSDADASEDNKKHQTPDTKDLTVGEYWFVLDEITAETDVQVTYGVKMYTSVEDLEADGYTYDGQGLDSVEDPDDGKDADKEDENADAETETGDALPYAVVLLGAAAVVAVVASKKRNNA